MWVFLAVSVIIAVRAPGENTNAVSSLEKLRSTFERECQKISEEEAGVISVAQDLYLKRLEGVESSLQKQGKLEPLLAAKKERERFAAKREIRDENLAKDIPEILAAQNEYLAALKRIPIEPARKLINLAGYYDKSLNDLKTELTKSGNVEAAIEVKKERDGIESRPEVVAARRILAELEARKTPEKTTAETTVKTVADVKTKKPAKKYNISPENQIRKRFESLVDLIQDQKWEETVKMVKPETVTKQGTQLVQLGMKLRFGWFGWTDNSKTKIQVESVKLAEDEVHAELFPKLFANNESRKIEKLDWEEVDGEWYLNFEAVPPEARPPKEGADGGPSMERPPKGGPEGGHHKFHREKER